MLKETDYNVIIGMLGCIAEESGKQGVSIKTIKRILQQYTHFPNEPEGGPERGRWLQKKFGEKNDEIHKGVPIREPFSVGEKVNQCFQCGLSSGKLMKDESGYFWHKDCYKEYGEECKDMAQKIYDKQESVTEIKTEETESQGTSVLPECVGCDGGQWLAVKQKDGRFWHIDCWKDRPGPSSFNDSKDNQWCKGCEESNEKGVKADSRGWWWHKECFAREGIKNPVQGEATECTECECFLMKGDCLLEKLCWQCFQRCKLGKGIEDGYKVNLAELERKIAEKKNGCFLCDYTGDEFGKLIEDECQKGRWYHQQCGGAYAEFLKRRQCDYCEKPSIDLDDENCCPDCRDTSESKEVEEDEVYEETGNQCIRCNSDLGRMHKDADGNWWHKGCHSDYRRGEGQIPPAVVQCTKCDCLLDSKDGLAMKLCRNCQDDDDDDEEQPSRNKKKPKATEKCQRCGGVEYIKSGKLLRNLDRASWHPKCWEEYNNQKEDDDSVIKKCEKCGEVVKHNKCISSNGLYWHHGCWDGVSKDEDDSIIKIVECMNCESILNEGDDFEKKLCLPCLDALEKMHKQDRKNVIHINAETVRTMIPSLVTFPDSLEGFPHRKLVILADALDKNRPKVKKSKSTAINDTRLRKWCREKLASLSDKEIDAFREDVK